MNGWFTRLTHHTVLSPSAWLSRTASRRKHLSIIWGRGALYQLTRGGRILRHLHWEANAGKGVGLRLLPSLGSPAPLERAFSWPWRWRGAPRPRGFEALGPCARGGSRGKATGCSWLRKISSTNPSWHRSTHSNSYRRLIKDHNMIIIYDSHGSMFHKIVHLRGATRTRVRCIHRQSPSRPDLPTTS